MDKGNSYFERLLFMKVLLNKFELKETSKLDFYGNIFVYY